MDAKSGFCVASHAGRDSLLDRKRINGFSAGRGREGVVEEIVETFAQLVPPSSSVRDLQVFLTCGIGPEHFEHDSDDPKWGTANRRMVLDVAAKYGPTALQGNWNRGKLVLSEIIRSQFMKQGALAHNIGHDVCDTYGDVGADGQPIW